MTHTAGIGDVLPPRAFSSRFFGETVHLGEPVRSLTEYGRLRVNAEPGTRFIIYTDHDATLGKIVEDVSGEPFDRCLREHVFEPLGMSLLPSGRGQNHDDAEPRPDR